MVSIIVPVYRAERWLAECIGSILAQTCPDWELLLIDDGSPDGCGALCDGFAARDPRIRVHHQENRGVAAARNAGISMARGDYITFCDADDAWEPEHLETLLEAMLESGAQMVSCNYKTVDQQGRILRQSHHISGTVSLKSDEDRADYMIRDVLGWKTGWEVWSRLFCADLLRKNQIRFREGCGYGEDLAFVLETCLCAQTVCGIPSATYRYRLHPDSITGCRSGPQNLDDLNEAARHVWQQLQKAAPELEPLFPLLHYGMLRGEYEKIPAAQFPQALEKIADGSWHTRQVRALLRQKTVLRRYYGSRETARILAWARFCIHRRPWQFRLEKSILTGDLFRKISGILWSET